MIFQIFSQNKYKRKKRKIAAQTAQGGRVNGFGSSRRLVGRFHYTGRKNRFGLKLREAKKNSFLFDRASADIFMLASLRLSSILFLHWR